MNERTEYWTTTGEWTASGTRRFVEATLAPVHGRSNLKVTINADTDEIIRSEIVDMRDERDR